MSPSSAASVGVLLSNKTLEDGELQVDKRSARRVTSEQSPTSDDPLAASPPRVEKWKLEGINGSVELGKRY